MIALHLKFRIHKTVSAQTRKPRYFDELHSVVYTLFLSVEVQTPVLLPTLSALWDTFNET